MIKKYYKNIDETLYEKILKNGLKVYVIVKKDFKEKSVFYGTKFGSFQTEDIVIDDNGNRHKLIGGLAHFLEHRLFENEKGNIMDMFDELGASVNAFTSYNSTVYFFSTTSNFKESLELLLDFPHEFKISEEEVENEKKIIIEELKMYKDMPIPLLFKETHKSLFKEHPLKFDVGGEIEEVEETTKEILALVHRAFYRPDNMFLVVVGDVNPEEVFKMVEKKQENKKIEAIKVEKRIINEPTEVNQKYKEITKNVNVEKMIMAYKTKSFENQSVLQQKKIEISLNMIKEMLFSESSENYEFLQNSGIVNNIDAAFDSEDGIGYFFVVADSNKMKKLQKEIEKIIKNGKQFLTLEKFISIKKNLMSSLLYDLNNCSKIAYLFTMGIVNNFNNFEMEEVINSITLEFLIETYDKYLLTAPYSVCVMKNKND